MKKKLRLKREFITRKNLKKREATPSARRKIDKKKYYGVKVNIKTYQDDIFNHFFQPTIFDKIFGADTSLATKINQYLFEVSSTYDNLLEKAKSVLLDSFKKGAKRVLDNNGDLIKADAEVDETSVDLLTNQQVEYYQNLTEKQSRRVDNIIKAGTDEGKSNNQIVEDIQKSIKKISKSSALRIARSEIIKSNSIAQVQTMIQAGIEEYNYISANDSKVSKICRHNQGPKGREKIYQTKYAGTPDNPLPVLNSHPNCRCIAVAYFRKS